MTEATTENERIARRVAEDIATDGNLELVSEVFAEDAVEHGPVGREVHGADAIEDALRGYLDAFPDFSATVEDAVSQGGTVAMRVTLRGTQEGEFMGIEPTGRSFEVRNMVFTRIEDGRIAERWVQPDTAAMLQQLGVIPEDLSTPGQAAE